MQVTENLFHNFYCSAQALDSRFGLAADSVHPETELTLQFAVAKDLHKIGLADQPIDIQILRRKFRDPVLLSELVQLTQVEHLVLNAMDIVETTLGDTTLDRHLATFMRHLALIAGTALTALVTLGRSTTLTGCFTTA